MHGLGSNEEDMFGLSCELDPGYEAICLRAPYAYGPGFAWFDVDWTEEGLTMNEGQFDTSVDLIAELLPQIGTDLIVGGFSQGAMLTAGLIQRHPHLVSAAILLSGRASVSGEAFTGRVFQAHGIMDDVIPFSDGESLRRSLAYLGENLDFHGYPMGHTVCEDEIADLNGWLASLK